MLKDLIKEVLTEQKLDEKKVKGITLKDLEPYIHGRHYRKSTTKNDFSKKLDPAPTRAVATVKQVAKVGGDKKAIDDDDLSQSGIGATFKDAWSDAIDNKGEEITVPGSPPSSKLSKGDLKAEIIAESAKITSKNDVHHGRAKQLLADLKALYTTSNPSGRTAYGQALKEINDKIASLVGSNSSVGDIALEPITAAMIDNGMDISRVATQASTINPLGGIDFTQGNTDASDLRTSDTANQQGQKITAGFNAQAVKLPSNIVNAMKLFEDRGTDLGNRLQSLEAVANDIKSGDFTSLPNAGDKLKFAAKANVLISLTNLAKVTDSSSAGFAFEKFICAFFNGIGAGGANGAIDAALKDGTTPTGWLPSSAKFLSGGPVTQASGDAGEIGVEGILDKYDRIIYFVFQKVKDPTGSQRKLQPSVSNDYSKIQVYITMVHRDKNIEVMQLDSSGDATYRDIGQGAPNGNLKIAFKDLRGTDLGQPTVTLPVLDSPNSAANSVAEFAKAQMTDNGGIFDQLMGIFGLLENMKKNTENYETTGGAGGISPAQGLASTEYLAELSKDYIDAKGMYAELFKDAGENVTGTGFAEGKKITSNFLKKLIEESFKK